LWKTLCPPRLRALSPIVTPGGHEPAVDFRLRSKAGAEGSAKIEEQIVGEVTILDLKGKITLGGGKR
jgi:hypothetical protein